MRDLILFAPELILSVTAFGAFGLALVGRGRPGSRPFLLWLTLSGLALAFGATAITWGQRASLFSGLVALDELARFFRVFALLATGLVVLSAWDFLRTRTTAQAEFYSLLLFATLGAMLAASARNLVLIYLAIEAVSITSYALAGFLRGDARAAEGALKYFIYGAAASAIMLYGLTLLFGLTGTAQLGDMPRALANAGPAQSALALPALAMVLVGLGFKIALVPFHHWAPDAYEGAATPVAAFLSVGPKAAGFAILARVLILAFPAFQPQWSALLAGLAVLTMTVGNLAALGQTNVKRMLAYSSIAQAGYMLIGLAVYSPAGETAATRVPFAGLNGLLLFLIAYLFTNLGAFAAVAAVEDRVGSTELPAFAGLFWRAPALAIALLLFLLSLIGIPPTAGFVGKLLVFGAALGQGLGWLAVAGVANSVISVYYYGRVVRAMFFAPAPDDARLQLPRSMAWALGLAALGVVLIAVAPQPFVDFAMRSIAVARLP
jgi:proton-translocating NADH-quinone oxidoreductase chain N